MRERNRTGPSGLYDSKNNKKSFFSLRNTTHIMINIVETVDILHIYVFIHYYCQHHPTCCVPHPQPCKMDNI